MSVLRDHYFKLGSDLPQERLTAATQLISELISVNNSEEWTYALNRLIKGIITTRQSAKFGFSMALTEVVNELINRNELTVGKYLDQLVETTTITGSMKGKEQRAVLFGRLFGLQVLINSKIILKSEEKYVSSFVEVLLELSNFKNWIRETGFFTLIQFVKLLQDDESIEFKEKIYIKILTVVNNLGLNLSTEGLAVYLSIPSSDRLSQKIPNLKANWKNGDPFHKGNLPVLAKVLKDVEVINDEESEDNNNNNNNNNSKKQKSSWNSRLPFVWDLIVLKFNQLDGACPIDDDEFDEGNTTIDSISSGDKSKKRKKKDSSKKSLKKKAKVEQEYISVKEFWKVVVDESLFSEKSSYERKYWGFEIFQKFITSLTNISLVEYLFTPNFMRCLINQHASSARMLYKIAQLTLKSVVKVTKEKPDMASIVLQCLLDDTKGGCWNFDLISKSRTIDEILQVKTQVNQFITILLTNFTTKLESQTVTEGSEKHSNDNILKWYLDKIVNLIKHNKQVQLSDNVIESILKKLIRYSFFECKDVQISNFLQSISKERFSSLLSELITTKLSNSNYSTWSTFCYETIKQLKNSEKCLVEFDEDLTMVENDTSDLLSTIISLNKKSSGKLYVFELLFSMCLIQLYMEDEETVQVINELKLVFENQLAGKPGNEAGDEEEDDNDQVDDSVVLTEIVLSFISRKSTLFKKLSTLVWENFLCKTNEDDGKLRVNDACFRLLFDVLEAKENKQGQQKLFGEDVEEGEEGDEDEDEDEDDGDEEDEKNDKDNDDEQKNGAKNDSDSDSDDDDDDDEDDDDDDDDDDLDEVDDTMTELDKQTNLKLAQALGIPTKESGEVKFDELDDLSSNDEEYESDSMDDEQMMAMDDELSRIFKTRQDTLNNLPTGNKRKLEVLEAKENMIFFKNRILGLLEIFNKVSPSLHYNLSFILPLINLMNLTLDKNLGIKAHKLLKSKISRTKIESSDIEKYYPEPNEYYDSLIKLVSELQEKANTIKSSNQSVIQSYNQSCIIVAKNLIGLDESKMEAIVDIYTQSLKQWCLHPDSKLQSALFFDFINWINSKKNYKKK